MIDVYRNPFVMVFVVAILVAVFVLSAGPGAQVFFHVDVGSTTFVDYRQHYGIPERWQWGWYDGRACRVYYYPTPFGYYREVYVIDGVVWQVTY